MNSVYQKLEKFLLKFDRDEMYDFLFIEDICNVFLTCYDGDENNNGEDFCPEFKKIAKHLCRSPYSPTLRSCTDSD